MTLRPICYTTNMSKSGKKSTQPTPMSPFNPFSVTLEGLVLLFSRAQPVGMFLVAVAAVYAAYDLFGPSPAFTKDSTGQATEQFIRQALETPLETKLMWLGIAIILSLFVLAITTMLHGIASYTALQISKGRDAKLSEAFNAVLEKFGRYFIVIFLMNIKIVLWGLLFIIPGIIAYYRYSFAGMLFFDEEKNLRGDQALQASSKLAKKGLLTVFASHFLFSIITFFYADRLIGLASQAILYREYTTLEKSKTAKPAAHPLAWLALAMPITIFFALIVVSVLTTQ